MNHAPDPTQPTDRPEMPGVAWHDETFEDSLKPKRKSNVSSVTVPEDHTKDDTGWISQDDTGWVN
ncbi:MAG: hypothetical protein WC824_12715 [Bacteroidota bacterium]